MRTLALLLLLTASVNGAVPDTNPGILAGDSELSLPEDGQAFYCTTFTTGTPNADEQRLLSWFDSNAQLSRLKSQTHWSHIKSDSTLFPRYWNGMADANGVNRGPLISSLPAVVVQRPVAGGGYRVVARFQAPSKYFADSRTLASAIAACIRADVNEPGHIFARPWNPNRPTPDNCPDCRPKPTPDYNPDPGPITPKPLVPDIEPEIVREEIEAEEQQEHGREVLIAIAVFALTLAFCYVKDRQAQSY